MKIVDLRTAVVEANYDWTYIRVYTDRDLIRQRKERAS